MHINISVLGKSGLVYSDLVFLVEKLIKTKIFEDVKQTKE